jgi:hypothetical protein
MHWLLGQKFWFFGLKTNFTYKTCKNIVKLLDRILFRGLINSHPEIFLKQFNIFIHTFKFFKPHTFKNQYFIDFLLPHSFSIFKISIWLVFYYPTLFSIFKFTISLISITKLLFQPSKIAISLVLLYLTFFRPLKSNIS